MKWSKDQKYDCETYLQTLAMGIHSPVAEEHVANCNFCRDIYHGGSEEFPLSLKEAADEMRAEKRRKARRKFLKRSGLVAAGILVGLQLGTRFFDSPVSTSPSGSPMMKLENAQAWLDAQYASKGRRGVETLILSKSQWKVCAFIAWIEKRRHVGMYDLLVEGLGDGRKEVKKAALMSLRKVDPADLKAHLSALQQMKRLTSQAGLRGRIGELIGVVESS